MSPTLLIDANQYLDLYRMVAGKKLLDSLEEQKAYIFVSAQIVDEVLRNKLGCARDFFSGQLKEIAAINAIVPDHLLGISDQKTTELRRIIDQAKQARNELDMLVADALSQISRSDDDVSKRLGALFDKSILPSIDEMQRARERKEKGNPPGKPTDALGDQITWEQLLTHCKERKSTRLWIVTRDQDYCVKCGKKDFLLNPLLRQNLMEVCGGALEIHCFGDLLEGITHFGKNANVTAEKLPTDEEAAEIKKEIEALPSIYSTSSDTFKNVVALQARGIATAGTSIGSISLTIPGNDTTKTAK